MLMGAVLIKSITEIIVMVNAEETSFADKILLAELLILNELSGDNRLIDY